MLTGGLVIICRTADALTGPTAFNGRLPADPRAIPDVPGSCYILSGLAPKPMLARMMWDPDYYDWVRDDDDSPIGYPAPLPPETLAAFGPDYAAWVRHAADPDAGPYIPAQTRAAPVEPPTVCVDAVRLVLAHGAMDMQQSMDMEAIDAKFRERGLTYSVRTIREALKKLREAGEVHSADGRHELTQSALQTVLETFDP
jgi:hypothetical protein